MEYALVLLKVIGGLVTAALGIAALLVDYRDHEGNVTKWGRRALVGIILSALVTVTSHLLGQIDATQRAEAASLLRDQEAALRQKQTLEILESSEDTLKQVRRAIERINFVEISVNGMDRLLPPVG